MNRVRIRIEVAFEDNASASSSLAVVDSELGTTILDGIPWPADLKLLRDIEEVLERHRNRYPKYIKKPKPRKS